MHCKSLWLIGIGIIVGISVMVQ